MYAKIARERTNKVNEAKMEVDITPIIIAIKSSIQQGNYFVMYGGQVSTEIRSYLFKLGYKIGDTIDNVTKISW